MRQSLMMGLSVLVCASAVGAEVTVPQDAARIEQRRRERLEWNRRTLAGAYDQVGKKDPRWDEPARKAMDLAARMFSQEVDPVVTLADIHTPARAALDAGCDDPLVRYLAVRSQVGRNAPGLDEAIRRLDEVSRALAASRYPAYRRMAAFRVSAAYRLWDKDPGDEAKKAAGRDLDAALALFAESVADDERNEWWEDGWLESLVELIGSYRKLGDEAEAAYRKVDDRLARHPEAKVLRLLVRGRFWNQYGWEARGSGFAAEVPAGAFELLAKRTEIAREAFEEAWRLRPGTAAAATGLLDIQRNADGDRERMELWFDRAMKADGDNREACWLKLEWIEPKWHGKDPEDLLAFGRACRDTKNWRAGITLLGADAHWRYGAHLGEGQSEYMKKPEVWAEIKAIYEEYLKHYPDNAVARSKLATYAYYGRHYEEAHAQYQALGDRLTQWSDGLWVPLEEMKRQREFTARVVGGEFALKVGWHRLAVKNNEIQWAADFPVAWEREQQAGILGVKARNAWSCRAGEVLYMVRVQPLPPNLRNEAPGVVLDAARSAVAREVDGAARDPGAVEVVRQPAQEYLVDSPRLKPRVARVRATVIGSKLYELSVTGSEADVAGKSADAFLNSFNYRESP